MAAPPHRTWQSRLTDAWLHRGGLAALLWPLSLVYGLLWHLRQRRAAAALPPPALPVPLVVVGNVVVGGAGKTPTTVALVQHWQAQGRRPGVVSKGHGRLKPQGLDAPQRVTRTASARDVGDEPLLIHQTTGAPVAVGPDRTATARQLLQWHPEIDVLVCDDGLQDLTLSPDVRVAVFDDRGVGNGWLLPAGMLRQPWPPSSDTGTGVRPDLILLTGSPCGLPLPGGTPVFQATRQLATQARNPRGERRALSELAEIPAQALAGIGRPQAFFGMLRKLGVRLDRTWTLNDHQPFDAEFSSKLFNEIKQYRLFLTEKDAVKLFPLLPDTADAWAVPLTLTLDPAFLAAVDARLSSRHGPQTA